ncbi:hypothetical protein [uncultured Ferrimonas sp.]|uniref:hypothetical protein n=1 Tax=uncultured Ferrimonas sp. TaxID=432640 RepID=UPI0026286727|nr:hypothetical protein [uncultured Ferrimonas sp.]
MIARLFLIPLVLCLLWTVYLRSKGYRIKQGQQGYIYILSFSGAILGFMTLMLWLT